MKQPENGVKENLTERFTLRFTASEFSALTQFAEDQELSLGAVIRAALFGYNGGATQ